MRIRQDCLFCKIAAGTIPANRVWEDDLCIAFPDINPQAPVHLLLVPKEHIVSQASALAEHKPLLGHLMAASAELARSQGLDRNGYRVVVNTGDDGGQTVHHLHLHLLGGRAMGWPPG
jgi:histidine triad (HIT) family protein